MNIEDKTIAIIGLGYVGLPLAVEFSKKGMNVIGFDINEHRVEELKLGSDHTLEVSSEDLKEAVTLKYTASLADIASADVYIVTVPTPITKHKTPNLTPLEKASEAIGSILKKGDIVIYESTVYPGCTEEVCVPILEQTSGLVYNQDFYCGYSPERINPGDKKHTVTKIKKVTSGSTPEIADFVDDLYKSVIVAGTFKAASIKVAEAAKVIENSQRDINIAFVNELSKIFNCLDIDTQDVLEAARTKWNFLPFTPGLVGGHCIGVDPYYLAQKAQEVGYFPEIILAGRRLNDTMGVYITSQIVKKMIQKEIPVRNSNILLLGITFKENCPDIRNSKVIDIYNEFQTYDLNVNVYDPWADKAEVKHEYGIDLISEEELTVNGPYDTVILAVAHKEFLTLQLEGLKKEKSVVYDVKSFFPKEKVDARL